MTRAALYFSTADYAVFGNGLCSSPEYDGERERVREKLALLHKRIYPEIKKRKWDLHPHWMSQWLVSAARLSPATSRIESMTLRYSKPEDVIKLMKRELIDDFGHFYANAMLAARVEKDGFTIELLISEKAWVDGQNLKRRLEDAHARGRFRGMLADLGGEHALSLAQFLREDGRGVGYQEILHAKASRMVNAGVLNSILEKYQPGGHDLRLGVKFECDDRRLAADKIGDEILQRFEQLYPIYSFFSWSPDNDYRKAKNANKESSRRAR